MKFTILTCLFLTFLCFGNAYGDRINTDYKNPKLPLEKRVQSLLSQMTLEEKLKQITQGIPGKDTNLNNQNAKVAGHDPLLGSVIFRSDNVNERNAIQKNVMEKSRLGIPMIFADDIIHGYRTIFPTPLAQSCSWNPALVEESCRITSHEAKNSGVDWTFSPMVDIARDPRWGRVVEGYGEDPYAASVYALAAVTGYQGKTYPFRIAACLKHYIGYGASEGGRDYAYTEISRQSLWDTYLPPFKAGVKAGAMTLMSGFNDVSGIPASGNRYTLTTVLRDMWGFKGFVVSDWGSILQMKDQGFVANDEEAGVRAINAGLDMDMMDGVYMTHMPQMIKDGKVLEKTIDEAAARVLRVKFLLGLFEKPYTNVDEKKPRYLLPEYLKTARQLAVESIVLLKNEDEVLPLSKDKFKKIALIGPLVKNKESHRGGGHWHARGRTNELVDIEEGLRKILPSGMELKFAQGCDTNSNKTDRIEEAVNLAKESDVVILCLGEDRLMSGENASRASIALPGVQEQLADVLSKTGKPIILLVTSGRPNSLHNIEPKVKSIVQTWQLGNEAGNAIASILLGLENPSGRLSITFPRTEGQIPIYYNMRSRGRPKQGFYQDISTDPMYWFGYGLSYTTYEYSNLRVSRDQFTASDQLTVSVDVRNTGKRVGKETVFLYMRDLAASVSLPMKKLIRFDKVELKPRERKTVTFTLIPAEDFSFANDEGKQLLEAGQFTLMVQHHKKDISLKK